MDMKPSTSSMAMPQSISQPPPPPTIHFTEDEQKRRFQVELEFVQTLANPHYLNFLAQRNFFKDECFVNYLKYLMYWKRQEYAKYLKYPQCLHFLELLQHEEFRDAMATAENANFCEEQQLLQWQFYIRKRQELQVLDGLEAEK